MYKISVRKSGLGMNYSPKIRYALKIALPMLILCICLLPTANVLAQRITYVQKQANLAQVFKVIKKQTHYNVVWFEHNLDTKTTFDANFKNATIAEVMESLLLNQPASYEINGKTIVIKPNKPKNSEKPKKATASGSETPIDVTGRVVDENNLPLIGAILKVKDSGKATVTNANGVFEFKDIPENSVLLLSYLGYQTEELKASANMKTITMVQTEAKLSEVEINAGYYTVKDKERTGSISRITAETISKQPVGNPLEAMIGRMAGVNIVQQTGVAGGGFKIEIRGVNSLRATARDPLYLVDGVPYPSTRLTNSSLGTTSLTGNGNAAPSPLNYLNPADIQSIEVLKDADATAIYGSRGSNGVVLITTKGAKSGKTSLDLNSYTGVSTVNRSPKLLTTQQYLALRNEAFKNDNMSPGPLDYDLNGAWDQNRYTDWQKVLTGGTARTTNIQGSVSGGNDLTQFAARGNYLKQKTVFPGDFADQKGSGTLTLSHTSVNRKFKANFSSTYGIDYNSLPRDDLSAYTFLAPNAPALYNANGTLNWALDANGSPTWINPMAATVNTYLGKSNSFLSSALLNYELIPGLILRSSLGYTNVGLKENVINPIKALSPSDAQTASNFKSNNSIETWIIEPQLNYQRALGAGKLDVLLGSTFQKNTQRGETITGSGYTSDLLLESITAAPTKSAGSSGSDYQYNALFGRLNYNYQDKYIVNLTGRRDGSSRFGPGKQFANFGAVGLAWLFNNENFIKEAFPFLSYGKLRGSYGITGSDQIGDYGYLDTYAASQPYRGQSGLIPTRLANPDYSWETNKKLEAALALGFIHDQILFTASFFQNRSSNQLVGYPLSDLAGFSSVQYNLPATVQNTGWEFELNTSNVKSGSFSWKTAFNLTIPRNKLLSYPNLEGSSYAGAYVVGQSLFTPKSYHYLGVNPQTGIYYFEDVDGNGNDTDEADRKTAGKSLTSHLYGGLQNSFKLKNFQLDIFFQFASKTAVDPLFLLNDPGIIGNQPVKVLDRWQKAGDQTDIQKFSQSFNTGDAGLKFYDVQNSDRFVDASFIRLKNVSLSWQAPAQLSKKLGLGNLRFYLQGQNLFTLTRYPGDPEVLDFKTLPGLRTLTAGLQIGLY